MIRLQGFFKNYKGDFQFSFALSKKELLQIHGENGLGKSTFFFYLKKNQKKILRGLKCSFLDQTSLAPLGDVTTRDLLFLLQKEFPQRVSNDFTLINEFDFSEKMDIPINRLSGGENQVLKLLSCFFLKSDFYFLDEPFQSLDVEKREILKNFIQQKVLEGESYFLLIDHKTHTLSINKKDLTIQEKSAERFYLGDDDV